MPRPIDPGGIDQLVRDRHHVLPQEEDPEGIHHVRHDDPPVGIEPAVPTDARDVVAAEQGDALQDQIVRDHRHLVRQHHRGQAEEEQEVAAGERSLGEGVGDQRAQEQLRDGDRAGNERAVQDPPPDRVVGERRVQGDPLRRVLEHPAERQERRRHHVRERRDEQDGQRAQEDVLDHAGGMEPTLPGRGREDRLDDSPLELDGPASDDAHASAPPASRTTGTVGRTPRTAGRTGCRRAPTRSPSGSIGTLACTRSRRRSWSRRRGPGDRRSS